MKLLPNLALLRQSVMVESRSLLNYFFRFFLVGVLLVILYITYEFSKQQRLSALGLRFFTFVSILNICVVTVAGICFFSTAVTEEKEDKTLDLLLMTGISPLSFLCSKFTSKLLLGSMLVLAQFPFTILAVTLGGISVDQIVSVYVSITAYMFFLAGISLLGSILASRTQTAYSLTVIFVVLFWGFHVIVYILANFVTDIVFKIGESLDWDNPLSELWLSFSPMMRLRTILTTGSSYNGEYFCVQVWVCLGLCLAAFIASWLLFNWSTRRHLHRGTAMSLKDKLLNVRVKKRKINTSRVWSLALLWKEFYFNSGGVFGMALRIILYLGLILVFISTSFDRYFMSFNTNDFFFCIYVTGMVTLPIEVVWLVSNMFRSEINNKTFSSIVLLPYSISQLAYQKLLVLLPTLLPCCLFMLIGFLGVYSRDYHGLMELYVFVFICLAFLFFIHLTVYLSLFLRYGAFAVALIITWVLIIFSGMFFAYMLRPAGPETWLLFLDFVFGVVTIFLHLQTFHRLRVLSSA